MTALLLELSDDLYEPIKQQALKKHEKPPLFKGSLMLFKILKRLFRGGFDNRSVSVRITLNP